MLKVISGPFQPTLERSFLDTIANLKKSPLTPVLVITPSSRQMDRLQKILVARFPTLMNVHFHTFTSAAQEIVDERPASRPVLSDPLYFDTVVKNLLKETKPFEDFDEIAIPEGFPSAVRSTLRDLLDAGVDEELVAGAMSEEFVGRSVDLGSLRSLLNLYRSYLKKLESLPVSTMADVLKEATARAPKSLFLKKFEQILFYGFYDLTGLQSEFFTAVVRSHPSHFFFPYVKDHPAYAFAKRFRDNVLQLIPFEEELENDQASNPKPSYFNVSGRHDEAWLVAREILKLKEKGLPFSEMAVIARTRERIAGQLPALLADWDIPFSTTAKRPLIQMPAAKLSLDLLLVAESDQLPLKKFEFDVSPQFACATPEIFRLSREWPKKSSWSDYSARLVALIKKSLRPVPEESAWNSVLEAARSLASFDSLGTISASDFREAFTQRLAKTSVASVLDSPQGVSLLHAEAARGLAFQAVFFIGVEEKVFPRIIREDPFLRDDVRMALRDTVGYKIGQKLSALEEERLLFHLISHSAQSYLTYVYQRSDDDGKVVGVSTFLRAEAEKAVSIPRPAFEKSKDVNLHHLGQTEAVVALLREGNDGWVPASLRHGLDVQKALHKFDVPTAYDGFLGLSELPDIFSQGAISPSSLETYGRCPFQFFARKVLRLEPLEEKNKLFEIPADEKGKTIHLFLKKFFENFSGAFEQNTFDQMFDKEFPMNLGEQWNIPSVLWAALRLELKQDLQNYLSQEVDRLAEENLTPTYFEEEWIGTLPPPLEIFPWKGTIDRVDVGPGKVVVVDYKTGKLPTNKVSTESLRGRRAQPPLYLLMAEALLQSKKITASTFEFAYHQIGKDQEQKNFKPEEWSASKSVILETISQQVKLMTEGNFLMVSDADQNEKYCRYCEVADICRRNHSISAYRARQGAGEKLAAIRLKTIKKKTNE